MAKAQLHRLGRVEYGDGLELQRLHGLAREQELEPDQLLLLEHSPVLTLGRAAKGGNVLGSPELLAQEGIELFETNRGGDVTYHGPGQLVGYPIVKLPPGRQDVRRYVRDLEEALIRTCADFGVTALRIPKWTGVWVGDEALGTARKIAAIGVHIARWQTSHGFALNVNTDLSHFGLIVPCGIKDAGVTSLSQQLGRTVPMALVEARLTRHLSDTLDLAFEHAPDKTRSICVAVTREERILLLRRTEARGGFWQLVTGKLEAGESALGAAGRELREETEIELPPEPLGYLHSFALGDALPPQTWEEEAFRVRIDAGQDVRLDPAEHVEHAWLTLGNALSKLPFAGLKAAARRAF